MKQNFGKDYSPLFFLAALGNGGLTVAFFIFFMFMTPIPDTPIPTFDSVWAYLGAASILAKMLGVLCYALMLYFAFNHFRMLIWNIREYRIFKKTEGYKELTESNHEITLMTIPLTLTMTINVMFVLGAMLVPGLWNIVEYLFPFAFLAFLATGVYALTLFYRYYSRILTQGQFQHSQNNSLSQMISSFTFAMSAVGFAAPVAMSENRVMIATAAFFSIFFFAVSALLTVKNMVIGFYAMMDKGVSREASASLWILIPIMTLLGIAGTRMHHGFHFLFQASGSPAFNFIWCSSIVSVQIFIGLLGYVIMRKNDYFPEFVHGINKDRTSDEMKNPATYALICPGVAFWVFGMFFLDKALVKSDLVTLFSGAYFVLLIPLLLVLFKTVRVNAKLNKRLLQEETV